MRTVNLAFWFMWKSFINNIKRSWKIWLSIIAVVGLVICVTVIFSDDAGESEYDYEESEEYEAVDDSTPNADLDFVWDDNGAFFYENGEVYDVGLLLGQIIIAYIVFIYIIIGVVSGAKKGVAIFEMADVNFLFPSPTKPQSVLLFKMINQVGTTIVGGLYILYQIPNIVSSFELSVLDAVCIALALLLLMVLSKFIGVFSYVVLSNHVKLKSFISKYGYFLLVLPVVLVILCHAALNMSYYSSVYAVFGSKVMMAIPALGWFTGLATYIITGDYLIALLFLTLIIVGTALLIYGTWQIKCDFYEDAFESAQEIKEANDQLDTISAGGMATNVKHEGRKWEKRRNKKLNFEGYEGASVFFGKTLLNRKRAYALGGFFSTTSSWYFFAGVGASLAYILLLDIPALAGVATTTCIVAVMMFFRSFANPLQDDLNHNFIYLMPETPFALLGWGMAGQVIDGAIDLIPLIIVLAVVGQNVINALLAGLFLLTLHFFFGTTALLVSLLLNSYIPKILSRVLQVIIRLLPFGCILLAFVIGVVLQNLYIAITFIIIANLCLGLLTFLPSPFLLHKGKKM